MTQDASTQYGEDGKGSKLAGQQPNHRTVRSIKNILGVYTTKFASQ